VQQSQKGYYLLIMPSVIVLLIVTVIPFLYLFGTSFTPLDLTRPETKTFGGLINYIELYHDHRFWNSVWVQVRLSVATVSLQLLIGLGIALLLNTGLRFIELIRAIFLIPMVLPPVVVAIIWKIIFTPGVSILNWILGLMHLPQPAWLTHPTLALWAIIVGDVWEWFPFTMLMFLASLQMIPDEPLEAAKIDGASYFQSLIYIILPHLKPILIVAGLFRLIDSIKAFPLIFIMTAGGPGMATEATNYYAYLQGLSYSFVGYSSAISVVMLIFTFFLSYLIIRTVGTEVEVE
jgi:multiple sugar transport system permease protein